jgi:ribosomal protein S1
VDRVKTPTASHAVARPRRREAAWDKLEEQIWRRRLLKALIFGRVKGGFVDLDGAVAFLPGSQVGIARCGLT